MKRAVRRRIYERDGWACVECGAKEDLTIDHIAPKSKGGANQERNYRTLCRPCNQQKGAKLTHAKQGAWQTVMHGYNAVRGRS